MVHVRRTYAGRNTHGHVWVNDGDIVDVEPGLASRLLAEEAVPMYSVAEPPPDDDDEKDDKDKSEKAEPKSEGISGGRTKSGKVLIRRTHAGENAHGHKWENDGDVVEIDHNIAAKLLAEPALPMYTLAEADAGATIEVDDDDGERDDGGYRWGDSKHSHVQGSHEPDKVRTGGAPVREDDIIAPRPGVAYAGGTNDKARTGGAPSREDDRPADRRSGVTEEREVEHEHEHKLADATAVFPDDTKKAPRTTESK